MRAIFLPALSVLLLAACDQKPVPAREPAPVAAATAPAAANAPSPDVINVPAAEVPAKLAGKWVATDDPQSTLVLTADGGWTSEPGHQVMKWRAFPGTENPKEANGYQFTPVSTYLEVIGPDGTYYYYELGGIEADAFEMFYTARGNHLAYTRVK